MRQGGASSRRCHAQDRGGDEYPSRQVEEAVDQRVRLQPGEGVHWLASVLSREHVVPLEDLVKDDAVDESAEPETHDERGGFRRSGGRGVEEFRTGRHGPARLPGTRLA